MKKYILLPADSYVVINKTILHDEDRKIITENNWNKQKELLEKINLQ